MNHSRIIQELHRNRNVFLDLLSGSAKEEYLWKPEPEKWCMLEIVCHLYDEEREDFHARLKQVLTTPDLAFPPIDPQGWVKERNYIGQDYESMLNLFSEERILSFSWLESLKSPGWTNGYNHPKFGLLTAELFLANWLEHDFLHLRQVLNLKHLFLKNHSGESLTYAGNW